MSTKLTAPSLGMLDDLFKSSVDSEATGKRFESKLRVNALSPFPNHPFILYHGERLSDMVESIKANSVLTPILVRETKSHLEILAGHNRVNASKIVGLKTIPAIVLSDISDEEALMYVIETNLMQRSFSDMKHSEKAAVIHVRNSKLFSQGKRNDILEALQSLENNCCEKDISTLSQVGTKLKSDENKKNSSQVGTRLRSDEKIAEEYSLSRNTVARYLRVYQLIPELKIFLDEGVIPFVASVTLSFLKEEEQVELAGSIALNGFTVDMKKADILREYSEKSKLDGEQIYYILNGEIGQKSKPNRTPTVKIRKTVYKKYFDENTTEQEVRDTVEKALALYFENLPQND